MIIATINKVNIGCFRDEILPNINKSQKSGKNIMNDGTF